MGYYCTQKYTAGKEQPEDAADDRPKEVAMLVRKRGAVVRYCFSKLWGREEEGEWIWQEAPWSP